jgi:hypothetical protein
MKKFKMEKMARLAREYPRGAVPDFRRSFDPDVATGVQPHNSNRGAAD